MIKTEFFPLAKRRNWKKKKKDIRERKKEKGAS